MRPTPRSGESRICGAVVLGSLAAWQHRGSGARLQTREEAGTWNAFRGISTHLMHNHLDYYVSHGSIGNLIKSDCICFAMEYCSIHSEYELPAPSTLLTLLQTSMRGLPWSSVSFFPISSPPQPCQLHLKRKTVRSVRDQTREGWAGERTCERSPSVQMLQKRPDSVLQPRGRHSWEGCS